MSAIDLLHLAQQALAAGRTEQAQELLAASFHARAANR